MAITCLGCTGTSVRRTHRAGGFGMSLVDTPKVNGQTLTGFGSLRSVVLEGTAFPFARSQRGETPCHLPVRPVTGMLASQPGVHRPAGSISRLRDQKRGHIVVKQATSNKTGCGCGTVVGIAIAAGIIVGAVLMASNGSSPTTTQAV